MNNLFSINVALENSRQISLSNLITIGIYFFLGWSLPNLQLSLISKFPLMEHLENDLEYFEE